MIEFDILIVGGGLVGASIAHMLSGNSLKIGVIEAKALHEAVSSSQDNRSIVLNYSSYQILDTLGVWQKLAPLVYPIKKVFVSQQGRFGTAKFDAKEINFPVLGYVVPGYHLTNTLQTSLHSLDDDLQIIFDAQVLGVEKKFSHNILTIKSNDRIHQIACKLLLACDGTNSKIRDIFNISVNHFDYKQTAIITTVNISGDHNHVGYERLTSSGPLAILPREEQNCGIILTVKNSLLEEIKNSSDETFLNILQTNFGYRLGKFLSLTPRFYYPLKLTYVDTYKLQNMILLGDAEQRLHIIAGQGFNLSLRKAANLAELILQSTDLSSVPRKYLAATEKESNMIKDFTHQTVQLFTSEYLKFGNIGLMGIDTFPFLKKKLFKKLQGFSGKASRLVYGATINAI